MAEQDAVNIVNVPPAASEPASPQAAPVQQQIARGPSQGLQRLVTRHGAVAFQRRRETVGGAQRMREAYEFWKTTNLPAELGKAILRWSQVKDTQAGKATWTEQTDRNEQIVASYNWVTGRFHVTVSGVCVLSDEQPGNVIFKVGQDARWAQHLEAKHVFNLQASKDAADQKELARLVAEEAELNADY